MNTKYNTGIAEWLEEIQNLKKENRIGYFSLELGFCEDDDFNASIEILPQPNGQHPVLINKNLEISGSFTPSEYDYTWVKPGIYLGNGINAREALRKMISAMFRQKPISEEIISTKKTRKE